MWIRRYRRVGNAGLEHVAGAAAPPPPNSNNYYPPDQPYRHPHSNPVSQSGSGPSDSAGPSRAFDPYGQPHSIPTAARSGLEPSGSAGPSQALEFYGQPHSNPAAAQSGFELSAAQGPAEHPILFLFMDSLTVTLPPPRVALSPQAAHGLVEHPSGDHAVATGSLAATLSPRVALSPQVA